MMLFKNVYLSIHLKMCIVETLRCSCIYGQSDLKMGDKSVTYLYPKPVPHAYSVTPRFPNNVNNTSNQSIQRKTECHTTFKT